MANIFRQLAGLPALLLAVGTLKADIEDCLKEPGVEKAWKRFTSDVAVKAMVPRLSAEWRAVEEAWKRVK